jgi:hypothetical protein
MHPDDDDLLVLDGPDDEPGQGVDDRDEVPLEAEPIDPLVEEAPSVADSPMERLRAAVQARFEDDTKGFLLPGSNGLMAIELKVLGPKETRALRTAAAAARSSSTKGNAQAQAREQLYELLIAAEVGLCIVDDGGAIPIVENGYRAGWQDVTDTIPAEFRNKDRSPRQGVIDAFRNGRQGKFNEFAFNAFVTDFAKWLADTTADLENVVDIVLDPDGSVLSETIDSGS